MSGVLLYVRLVVAAAVVLAPGWLIARALGVRGVAASLAWGLVAVFVSLGVTFVVSGTLTLTLVLLLGIGVAALPLALRRAARRRRPPRGTGGCGGRCAARHPPLARRRRGGW